VVTHGSSSVINQRFCMVQAGLILKSIRPDILLKNPGLANYDHFKDMVL
jgi:hypothetical protein